MINKNTKLPISVIGVAVSAIAGGIWSTATLWTEYQALRDTVVNIRPYDDAWIKELSDSNMNAIIRLETQAETFEGYDDEDIRHIIEGQDFRLQEVERTVNRLDGIIERLE